MIDHVCMYVCTFVFMLDRMQSSDIHYLFGRMSNFQVVVTQCVTVSVRGNCVYQSSFDELLVVNSTSVSFLVHCITQFYTTILLITGYQASFNFEVGYHLIWNIHSHTC